MAILHGTGWLICTERVFSAMKRRMESSIRSRIFHNQVLEAICKATVWNAISLAYNMI